MEKLEGISMNIVQDNIEKLKEIFPEIFIEGKIDFEVLKQLLGEKIEIDKERYSFTWKGKAEARQIAQDVSTGTLRPSKEDSKDWDNTENLYIEGDNLEVLKLLQKSYYGKIKMIYIDPPYNTGKDFVYKDKYKDNLKNYLEMTGQLGKDGQKLTTNLETDGGYHSNWLNMMYPRLKLARNLLTDDGVIFISIDDNEQENLKKICNEIFGENNFISNMIWAAGKKNDSRYVSNSHEYILIYVKNIQYLNENQVYWRTKKEGIELIFKEYDKLKKEYTNNFCAISENLKKWYKSLPEDDPVKKQSHYCMVDEKGIYFPDNLSWPGGGGPRYEVLHPVTGKPCKIPSRGWIFSKQEKMLDEIYKGNIHFGEDENSVPCRKAYLKDRMLEVPYSIFYKDGRDATKKLMEMFDGKKIFDFPKDISILKKLFLFNDKKDSIVLDFFSGSAATAHAVMQLNAEDGGNRKHIMVQFPEICKEETEAYKAGYKNICEIGKERIRRAGEKIKEELEKENSQLKLGEELKKVPDIGFKVFKLDSSNIKEWDTEADNLKQMLLDSVDNIKSDRTSLDVLYEVLLKYGLDLNVPIEENEKFYSIGGGTLLVCINKEIDIEIIDLMCEEYRNLLEIDEDFKTTVILRDSAFKNDVDKTNAMKKLEQAGIKEVRSI